MKIAHDPLVVTEVKDYITSILPTATYDKIRSVDATKLDRAWRNWLESSKHNRVNGLELFRHSCFSAGTTPAFGEFISRNAGCRVRVSRSDFLLTKILARSYQREIKFLEDGPVESTDCVIMSVPFSGNGSYIPGYKQILDQADELNIPVMIDGAYFGISHGIEYPLERKCVTDFALSLTKNFAGNPFRLGIRFTKNAVDDGISAGLLSSGIFDQLGAWLSIQLLEKFPHTEFIDQYRIVSDQLCQEHELIPTNTITIAIGDEQRFASFKRGDFIRVCLSNDIALVADKIVDFSTPIL